MRVETIEGVRVAGVAAALPPRAEDSLARCTELFGDAARAASVVAATGIATRRLAEPGVTPLDLCVVAAERLFNCLAHPPTKSGNLSTDDTDPAKGCFDKTQIGAVVFVSFTSPQTMPCAAAQAQARLGLSEDVQAFDVGLACSGYVHGLYLAKLLARSTGRAVLLLDGDVQSRVVRPDDESTVPLLADAGTATLLVPDASVPASRFAFLTKGAAGAALTCPAGGPIKMDGLAVFKFVSTDILQFLQDFVISTGVCPPKSGGLSPAEPGVCPPKSGGLSPQILGSVPMIPGVCPQAYDAFVPHQPNIYLVRRLAKALGFDSAKIWISTDKYGNSASATIPVTLAHIGQARAQKANASPDWCPASQRLLLAGFGGGLAAAACDIVFHPMTTFEVFDFE